MSDRDAARPKRDLERRPHLEPEASTEERAAYATAVGSVAPQPPAATAPSPEPVTGRGVFTEPAPRIEPGLLELQFVGTATLVLRLGDFTVLTDPNFVHKGRKVDLGYGMKSARLTDPAVEITDLPHLDLALVSHLHGDHFDRLAAALLDRRLPVVTNAEAGPKLNLMGFRDVQGLHTWRSLDLRKNDTRLRITAMPAQHAPWPLAPFLPAVMGSLIDVFIGRDRVLRLYITGDTLIHDRLRQIPQRFAGIDLAVLHLGGTRLAGVKLTMDGQDGVDCMRIVSPRAAIPAHYDDYPVFKSPLSEFRAAVDAAGLNDRVRYVGRGERVDLAELASTVAQTGRAERFLPRRFLG